jgi:hypothetical protein
MNTAHPLQGTARRAGLIYLLLCAIGPINAIYIPSTFVVAGDPAATAQNILANELVYRLGALAGLASNIVFLALVLMLYQLLRDVHRGQARLMIALVGVSVAIEIGSLAHQLAPLIFLKPRDYLSVFSIEQLHALALCFFRLSRFGVNLATVFWGLWLLPFGYLTIRSGFFPKWLGWLLIVGGVTYATLGITFLVFPAYGPVISNFAIPFYAAGELCMIFWLLFMKLRSPVAPQPGSISPA